MPQVLALVIAGAGLFAGIRWVQRTLREAERAARRSEPELSAAEARGGVAPKDLGPLEYDAESGAYRPRKKG